MFMGFAVIISLLTIAEVAHACYFSKKEPRRFAISRKTETSDSGGFAKIFPCTKVSQALRVSSQWCEIFYFNDCRDGLGQFAHLPHYMKIYDASKAAYSNYQVSYYYICV